MLTFFDTEKNYIEARLSFEVIIVQCFYKYISVVQI